MAASFTAKSALISFIALFQIVCLLFSPSDSYLVAADDDGDNDDAVAQGRAVGGEPAKPHEFPFMAYLGVLYRSSTKKCGGTLIGPQWVLTAAHCLVDRNLITGTLENATGVQVQLGRHDVLENSEQGMQTLNSSRYFVHPNFDPATLTNDIALVKLQGAATMTPQVDLIPLPDSDFCRTALYYSESSVVEGCQSAIATGWGKTENGRTSAVLKKVTLGIREYDDCTKVSSLAARALSFSDAKICAGGRFGEDTCDGDSGGPLFCNDSFGYPIQIGVTSYGDHECSTNTGTPGVYARICAVLSFIRSQVPLTPCESSKLPNVRNGTIQFGSNNVGAMRTIVCNAGFVLIGDNVVRCLTSGRWSTPRNTACRPIGAAGIAVLNELDDEFKQLMTAIRNNDIDVGRNKIRAMKDVNQQGVDDGKSFLMQAVENRTFTLLRELVNKGINVNLVDKQGNSALHYAVIAGDEGNVDFLIANNATLDAAERSCSWTPLAVCFSSLSGDSTIRTGNKCTPQIMFSLLKAGASMSRLDCTRRSSLQLARQNANDEVYLSFLTACLLRRNQSCFDYLWNDAAKLIRGEEFINKPFGNPPKTILQHLVEQGKLTTDGGWLRSMLDAGLDPASPPYILNLAVRTSSLATIQMLADAGACTSLKGLMCNQTLLMDCANTIFPGSCDYEKFRYLVVEKRARQRGRNCLGQSLLDIASENSDPRFYRLLVEGEQTSTASTLGWTPTPSRTTTSTRGWTPTPSRLPMTTTAARTTLAIRNSSTSTSTLPVSNFSQCGLMVDPSQQSSSSSPSNNNGTDQHNSRTKIARGVNAPKIPWMVSITVVTADGTPMKCGGSLIGPKWVLTAAHCLSNFRNTPGYNIARITVALGKWDSSIRGEPNEVTLNASAWMIHPNFTGETLDNNFGLIQLNESVAFSRAIHPACLPSSNNGDNSSPTIMCDNENQIGCSSVTVAGWGLTEAARPARILQMTELEVMSTESCIKSDESLGVRATMKNNFCTKSSDGRDTCNGDSGGPVMCEMGDRYFLVGIVSYGGRDCDGTTSVNARVCSALPWIKQVTGLLL